MAAAALAGGWVGWMLVAPQGRTTLHVSNVGLTVIAVAAAGTCFLRSRTCEGRLGLAWRLFAAAALSWGAGQMIWTYFESIKDDEPFPSPADIGYLGFLPLAVAALLALPTSSARLASKARSVLDGLVIASSVLFVGWATLLGAIFRQEDVDGWEMVVLLAYPVGDVVLISMALLAYARSRRYHLLPGWTLALLSVGLLAIAAADIAFAYLVSQELYQSGSATDLGWFGGFGLLLLAALKAPVHGVAHPEEQYEPRTAAVLIPYVAVVLAVAVGAYRVLDQGGLGPILSSTALVVILLIVVRHGLTLSENLSLTRDLEERVRARTAQLHHSEQRFRSLVQHSSDVITVTDPTGVIAYQSGPGQRVFGYDPSTLLGTNFLDLVHADDQPILATSLKQVADRPELVRVVEFSVLGRDGSWCQTETTITNVVSEPSVGGLVLNTRDVTERKLLEGELLHGAFHDSLTQLSNRRLFTDRLHHALAQGRRSHRPIAVLFLDLDGFKGVNDSFGHESGDRVLVEVAERLQECVREADTVARLGGDEFGILLEDLAGDSEVNAVADRVCDALRAPFRVDDREVFLAGSVGIAGSQAADETAEELLRNADLAMYRAKSERHGGYRWYEPAMHRSVVLRLELDADLRRVVDRGELYVEYQPILDLRSGRITGAEALVRWNHPVRGVVGPAEFIPAAESNGSVVAIGEWVLGEACEQLRRWQVEYDQPCLSISVNLSGRQLHQRGVTEVVSAAIEHSGVDPATLVLEVTESILIAQTEDAISTLAELKDLGVRLAVDDFGTGYSALSYLHRLPVDIIKIDKFFIDCLTSERANAGLAASIVRIGRDLRLVTVAEGVEEQYQLDVLREMGCDLGQGFLLAAPLGAADFGDLLSRRVCTRVDAVAG